MRLLELRKLAGLSQKELAKILNCSQNMISQWENGTRDPSTDTLKAMADYFNVTIDYLLGRTDENAITSAAVPAQDALTTQEETHIKKYRQLDTDGKEEIDDIIDVKLAKLQRSAEKEEESLG